MGDIILTRSCLLDLYGLGDGDILRIRKENLRGMLGAVIAVSCLGTAAYAQAAPAALDRSQPTAGSTQGDLHQK